MFSITCVPLSWVYYTYETAAQQVMGAYGHVAECTFPRPILLLSLPPSPLRMPRPFDLCARVQNAFRARHKRVCVDHTTQNLGILSILLRAGFLITLTRGTTEGPFPDEFSNVGAAYQRIWADLKYRDDRPVLTHMELISRPSKRVFMDAGEIRRICSGRRAQQVTALGMGEVAVVHTSNKEYEWLEAREAVRMGLDGEVVCRAR